MFKTAEKRVEKRYIKNFKRHYFAREDN